MIGPEATDGDLAGRYRLEQLLSRGGMGEVWRALDVRLGRPVAVKVLDVGAGPAELSTRERFLREARLTAGLSHHNVVSLYDVGEWRDRPYLVMELLDGRTLGDELAARGPFDIADVCDIGAQVADGLAAAHAVGVIHRDVKPQNLFLLPDGTVKILDFGIARLADDAATRLTRTGLVIGTAAYVAPELLTNGGCDERSDLYSLGCVLYELVAGAPPFTGGLAALAYAHVHHEPAPLAVVRPVTPPGLAGLLTALLAKDPAERPDSAREVAAWLRDPEDPAYARLTGRGVGRGAAGATQLLGSAGPLSEVAVRTGELPSMAGSSGSAGPAGSDWSAGPAGATGTGGALGVDATRTSVVIADPPGGREGAGGTPRGYAEPDAARWPHRVLTVLLILLSLGLIGALITYVVVNGRAGTPAGQGANATATTGSGRTPASSTAATPRASARTALPAYGSQVWWQRVDDEATRMSLARRLDLDVADRLHEQVTRALQEYADGHPAKARRLADRLVADLQSADADGKLVPHTGILGRLLQRQLPAGPGGSDGGGNNGNGNGNGKNRTGHDGDSQD